MLPNPQFPADLVTFIEEILNRKNFNFLCSDCSNCKSSISFPLLVEKLIAWHVEQRCIQNPDNHTEWSFSRKLFSQKAPSWMFDRAEYGSVYTNGVCSIFDSSLKKYS